MSPTCLVRALLAACLTATCVIAGNLPPAEANGTSYLKIPLRLA